MVYSQENNFDNQVSSDAHSVNFLDAQSRQRKTRLYGFAYLKKHHGSSTKNGSVLCVCRDIFIILVGSCSETTLTALRHMIKSNPLFY